MSAVDAAVDIKLWREMFPDGRTVQHYDDGSDHFWIVRGVGQDAFSPSDDSVIGYHGTSLSCGAVRVSFFPQGLIVFEVVAF